MRFALHLKIQIFLLKRVVEVKVSLTLSQFQKVTFDDLTEFGFKTIKAI